MNKKTLESYQANKRLIKRNEQKIEDEQCKDVSTVMGKVTGSSANHPYTKRRFTVLMNDPGEVKTMNNRIAKWKEEIAAVEREMIAVEQFVNSIEDAKVREIFTYRYIDGMKVNEIAKKIGYTHGRVSQIISKYTND